VLMRGRGMKRCRAEGAERFALFVGAAVLANNLMIIGEPLTNRSRPGRKTNRQFVS
jgi:transposase, IS5 family